MPRYTVQEVIERGWQIINKNKPTYSQENRGSTMNASQYDCSSFMGTINGVGEGGWPPATPDMKQRYQEAGYIWYPYVPEAWWQQLKKGDVLVYNKPNTSGYGNDGHTAMYIGGGQQMEMRGAGAGVWHMSERPNYWQDILRNPRSGIYIKKWEPDPKEDKSKGWQKA